MVHGEPCQCIVKSFALALDGVWEKAIGSLKDNICKPPEQYGDKCENCDGILEPEACQCAGYEAARAAIEKARLDG